METQHSPSPLEQHNDIGASLAQHQSIIHASLVVSLCIFGVMSKEPVTTSTQLQCQWPEKCCHDEKSKGQWQVQGQWVANVGGTSPTHSFGMSSTATTGNSSNHGEMLPRTPHTNTHTWQDAQHPLLWSYSGTSKQGKCEDLLGICT